MPLDSYGHVRTGRRRDSARSDVQELKRELLIAVDRENRHFFPRARRHEIASATRFPGLSSVPGNHRPTNVGLSDAVAGRLVGNQPALIRLPNVGGDASFSRRVAPRRRAPAMRWLRVLGWDSRISNPFASFAWRFAGNSAAASRVALHGLLLRRRISTPSYFPTKAFIAQKHSRRSRSGTRGL